MGIRLVGMKVFAGIAKGNLIHINPGLKESNEKIGDNNRLELISGNFFEAIPIGCDLYILRKIIHDLH